MNSFKTARSDSSSKQIKKSDSSSKQTKKFDTKNDTKSNFPESNSFYDFKDPEYVETESDYSDYESDYDDSESIQEQMELMKNQNQMGDAQKLFDKEMELQSRYCQQYEDSHPDTWFPDFRNEKCCNGFINICKINHRKRVIKA